MTKGLFTWTQDSKLPRGNHCPGLPRVKCYLAFTWWFVVPEQQLHCPRASSSSSDYYEFIWIRLVFTQIVAEYEFWTRLPIFGAFWNYLLGNLFQTLIMSMRKTTLALGQLLHSVHMATSYHGKAGYLVLYNGLPASRSCPWARRNSCEQLQTSDHAPRQSWPLGQWVAPRQWAVPGSCEQALKGCSPQVEVKSRKTKENGISHMWETAIIRQTREILTSIPTFIQGVSEKLLKNGEHKLPPVHTFIWRFSIVWTGNQQCSVPHF